jgi:uncharacterized membrane protein HdeD (DUF308 family)
VIRGYFSRIPIILVNWYGGNGGYQVQVFSGCFAIAFGILLIVGAKHNRDQFMNMWRGKFMIKLLSREGARLYYFIAGIASIIVGILLVSGVFD